MKDDQPRACRHCHKQIWSDLTRGWVSPRTTSGVTMTAYCRKPGTPMSVKQMHEPIPLHSQSLLEAYLQEE